MTDQPITASVSRGTVLCILETDVEASDLDAFARQAREIIGLAERFGGRSLGVFVPDATDSSRQSVGSVARTMLFSFANRPAFDAFSIRLQEDLVRWPRPVAVRALDSLPEFSAASAGEPRIPYHLLKYH